MAQGLSAGGEAAAASAFVVEYAPVHRRGWYGGWIWATLAFGLAAATGTATLLAWWLSPTMLQGWVSRFAFLVALSVGLVGLYLRLRLDEMPHFALSSAPTPLPNGRSGKSLGPIRGRCWSDLRWLPPPP
jgi:MHS family proline/betaine transporter-like MFS transporter